MAGNSLGLRPRVNVSDKISQLHRISFLSFESLESELISILCQFFLFKGTSFLICILPRFCSVFQVEVMVIYRTAQCIVVTRISIFSDSHSIESPVCYLSGFLLTVIIQEIEGQTSSQKLEHSFWDPR